jgi:hypothetical protein
VWLIGGDEDVTVDELVETVIDVSGKEIAIEHVEGPVGVQPGISTSRRSSRWGGRQRQACERVSPRRMRGLKSKRGRR